MRRSVEIARKGPGSRSLRRKPFLLAPLLALLASIAPVVGSLPARGASADPASDAVHLGTLTTGQPLSWDGFFPFSADPGDLAWDVELVGNGHRLRVAFDIGSNDTTAMIVRLIDPSGRVHGCGPSGDDACSVADGEYSVEIFAENPVAGTWRIELDPGGVCGRNFLADATDCPGVEWRMRAKLEAAQPTAGSVLRLPNLRVEPPFGFDRTTAFNCLPEETAQTGETTCLRFSFGPQNAGEGPLDLRLAPLDADLVGDVTQLVHHRDATRDPEERPAGTYEFHLQHRHFHMRSYSDVKLYRVVDPEAGTLLPEGDGHKIGFCLIDVKMVDWQRFFQGAQGGSGESRHNLSTCRDTNGARMGLTEGWADIYESTTQGNYVDFSGRGDGLYVVRAQVDPGDEYLETSEEDNFGYAFVRVTDTLSPRGPTAELLERGQGLDPWDPNKVVYPKLVGPDNF